MFLSANGLTFYYEQHGHGPDLWLVGGYTTNRAMWQHVLPLLTHQFRVTFIENRGSGQSSAPPPPYRIADMAQDVVASMDALGIPNAGFLGHSMGGAIVQQLLIEHPERVNRAVLASTTPIFSSQLKYHIRAMRDLFFSSGVKPRIIFENLLPWLYGSAFLEDEKKVEKALEYMGHNPYPQTPDGNQGQIDALLSFNVADKIHTINKPVHIIVGEEDSYTRVADAQKLHAGIRGSTLSIVPRAGHVLYFEAPKELAKAILER